MHHKFTREAQYVYSAMVPITVLAFVCAQGTIDNIIEPNAKWTGFDIAGLIIVGIGVFIHNFYPEKS